MKGISNWTNKEVRLLNPTEGLEFAIGTTFKCLGILNNDMVKILMPDESVRDWRIDRFELVEQPKAKRKISANMTKKKEINEQTRLEAINHKEPWKDEELEEIFLSNIVYDTKVCPDLGILEFCEKFKRTYYAIEGLVREKEHFKKHKEIRTFWYDHGQNSFADQLTSVLTKLSSEKRI